MKKITISILSTLAGTVFGAGIIKKKSFEKEKTIQSTSDKHLALFLLMNQWMKLKHEGKNLATYFKKNNYKKIAIYGMSYVGQTLVDELQDTDIVVAYGIDKNGAPMYADVDIVSTEDELEEVDAVVVTAITFFDEIEERLSDKVDCPIISLEDILYEI